MDLSLYRLASILRSAQSYLGQPADSNLHVNLCCTAATSAEQWLQEGRSTIEDSNFVCLQGNLQPGSECHRQ